MSQFTLSLCCCAFNWKLGHFMENHSAFPTWPTQNQLIPPPSCTITWLYVTKPCKILPSHFEYLQSFFLAHMNRYIQEMAMWNFQDCKTDLNSVKNLQQNQFYILFSWHCDQKQKKKSVFAFVKLLETKLNNFVQLE